MPNKTASSLLLAPNCSHNLLSPNSALTRNSPTRRRNSYAAPLTQNAVAVISAARNSLNFANGYRQSLVSIHELDSNMLMPVYASGISPSGAQFLDPSSIVSNNVAWRRRLPPTPEALAAVNNNNSIRRGSSPRILPIPPPPQMPLNNCPQSSLSPDVISEANMCLQRRPSSGRRLPAEPLFADITQQINSPAEFNSLQNQNVPKLATEVVHQLQRSVSTKNSSKVLFNNKK